MRSLADLPVLVSGASGFLGASLVRRLLDLGAAVHVLVRDPARARRLRGVAARLAMHTVDLRDAAAAGAAVGKARPRAVWHLAAAGAHDPAADVAEVFTTNLVGTANLLAAAQAAGVPLFVNLGSSSEYGRKDAPMREDDLGPPATPYGAAKLAQTHLVRALAADGPMNAVTLRPFSVFGPWEEPRALVSAAILAARAGTPLDLASPDAAHDWVWVDDVVDALVDVDRLGGRRGDAFNLGSGVQATNREVVERVLEVVGRRVDLRWGVLAPRPGDAAAWVADPAKAAADLGWTARTPLARGVAKLAEWIERGSGGADGER